jgi:hypothetical protein
MMTAIPADRETAPAPARQLGVVPSILLVVGVFVLAAGPFVYPSLKYHANPIDPLYWGRYDSGIYLDIAKQGYSLGSCSEVGQYGGPGAEWCGRVGWMAGYPFLIRVTHVVTGIDYDAAGLGIARLFHLGSLALVWFVALGRRWSLRSLLVLLLAAFFVGEVYQYAIYPMSMATFFALTTCLLLARQRYAVAGLAAGVVTLTHTIAPLIVPVGVAAVLALHLQTQPELWRRWRQRGVWRSRAMWRRPLRDVVAFAAPALAIYGVLLAWFQIRLGHWNAAFLVQQGYGHRFELPHQALHQRIAPLFTGEVQSALTNNYGANRWLGFLALVTTVVVVVLVGAAAWRWKELTRLEVILALYTATFFLVAMCYGPQTTAFYRTISVLLPGALLARRLHPLTTAALTGLSVIASFGLAFYYIEYRLY